MEGFTKTKNQIYHSVRAKFYKLPDGSLKLASVQAFSDERFREKGWEDRKQNKCSVLPEVFDDAEEKIEKEHVFSSKNIERASRRARKSAFDLIMCNHDLDIFVTFTYSPDSVSDKADYDECYQKLKVWLSNRVERRGLKYVLVPERTKAGDIHFHAIMNSEALSLVVARSAKTGKKLTHQGKNIFNVKDWKYGFTTAEHITRQVGGDDERAAVAKYIFKYMGKQSGQKIGGRYCLTGGDLTEPVVLLSDDVDEFLAGEAPKYLNVVELDNGAVFKEWSFV